MKVERLELVHLRMPLVRVFETGAGRFPERELLLVRAGSGGASGWGEAPAGSEPVESPETVRTAWDVIRDFLAPRLRGRELSGPGPVSDLFAAVRGHPMAKAAVEMAVLDLMTRLSGRPLAPVLGGDRAEIPAGVSLGVEERVEDVLRRMEEAVGCGYRQVKIRIRPGWDLKVLAEVRRRFPSVPLVADADGTYGIRDADHLRRLDEFGLLRLEQPLDGEDLVDHARLQERIRTPVGLDQSIRSFDDARRAVEIGACRGGIEVRVPRVGGLYQAKMIHNLARAMGIPAWCGDSLESGVGRAHAVALAALPHFTIPGDVCGSDWYYREDLVDPPVRATGRGTIMVPQGPGMGFSVGEDRLERYLVRREEVWL